MSADSRYMARGVSASKEDVHNSTKCTLEAATRESLRELETENATLLKVLGK